MIKKEGVFFVVFLLLFVIACSAQYKAYSVMAKDNDGNMYTLKANKYNEVVLKRDIDLKGKACIIPEGLSLVGRGGVLKNGTLIGNGTKIEAETALFSNVIIKGGWVVPNISTKLFKDLSYDNSLRDVLALSSSSIENTITIEKGDYNVSATDFGAALQIYSNTDLIINGTIHLIPNDFRGCYVLSINNTDNVVVRGEGMIEGDRVNHTGAKGEWGHGIYIDASNNVSIKDITISNCWGDCIYVGGNSTNVTISGCELNKGRRQGISITSGRQISVLYCDISEIYGTDPQFAIDIEPNNNETVSDVLIEGVRINNCFGGIMSWGGASGCTIGNITLRRCSVKAVQSEFPVRFFYGKELVIQDCVFATGKNPGLVTNSIKQVSVDNNTIYSTNQNAVLISRARKKETTNNRIIK